MQDKPARRKAVNVTVDAALLAEAKAAGINLSATLEAALTAALREHRTACWREENREALTAIDTLVEKEGNWLDEFRTW